MNAIPIVTDLTDIPDLTWAAALPYKKFGVEDLHLNKTEDAYITKTRTSFHTRNRNMIKLTLDQPDTARFIRLFSKIAERLRAYYGFAIIAVDGHTLQAPSIIPYPSSEEQKKFKGLHMRIPLPVCAVEMKEKKHGEYDVFLPPAALYLVLGKECAVTAGYNPSKLEAKIAEVVDTIAQRKETDSAWLNRQKNRRSAGSSDVGVA